MLSASRARRLSLAATALVALTVPSLGVPTAQAAQAAQAVQTVQTVQSPRITGRQVVYTHLDARRDAYGRTDYEDGTSAVTTHGTGDDLSRLTIVSDGTTLQANLTTRTDTLEDFAAWVRIATAAGRVYYVGYVLTTDTLNDHFRIVRRGSRGSACDGGRAYHVDAGIVLRVPLACLGDPTQIRVGAETWGIYPVGKGGGVYGETISYDDALRTGPSAAARANRSAYLPRRGYAAMSGPFAVR